MARNFYTILGVDRGASQDDIRRRFKELARTHHPDRFSGEAKAEAEEKFQVLTEAFNVLTNPERRRKHDLEIVTPASQGTGSPARTGTAPAAGASTGAADRGQAEARSTAETVRAYLARGTASYKRGDAMAAAESFERATKADPNNAKAWHHLALALHQTGRFPAKARSAISRACKLEPMKATYHKLAGRIHAADEEWDEAEAHYRQALTWGGDDEAVQQALEQVQAKKKSRSGFFGRG